MKDALLALNGSRKVAVGLVGAALIAAVYIFGGGTPAERITAMVTFAGIVVSIITAIGAEDAAKSAAGMRK